MISARLGLLTIDEARDRVRQTLTTLISSGQTAAPLLNYYDTTSLERTSPSLLGVDSAWLTQA